MRGTLLGVAAAALLAAGCGKAKTPEEAYRRFSAAVMANDGGALYDALDQRSRWAYMTVQKYHREAYDIVLSNYPEGPVREREKRRFESAATASSGRELFRVETAPVLLPMLRPLAVIDARIEPSATDGEAYAVLSTGIKVLLLRGKSGGWGFGGLVQKAEEAGNRAYHDLEVVRASAADYERAAARAGK